MEVACMLNDTGDLFDKTVINEIHTVVQNTDTELFVITFSGGIDSQLSMEIIIPILKTLKLPYIVTYVDVADAIPNTKDYANQYTTSNNIDLHIVPSHNSQLEDALYKKQWPSSLRMQCRDDYVYIPLRNYIKTNYTAKYTLITGSRKNQVQRSKNIPIKYKDIISPLAVISKVGYNALLSNTTHWPGYDMGFRRTACWSCPFQPSQQYEALRYWYPDLWHKLLEAIPYIDYPYHAGDGYYKRFAHYWFKHILSYNTNNLT